MSLKRGNIPAKIIKENRPWTQKFCKKITFRLLGVKDCKIIKIINRK